jgi:hypothetical protein
MNQTCDAYHNLVQAVCKGFFKVALAAAIVQVRAVSPGPNVQINSSNSWPFRYVHYDVLATCISWHYSVCDFQSILVF